MHKMSRSLPTLLPQGGSNDCFDDDGRPKRTGALWTTTVRIGTALIGPGILLLPWAMVHLGLIIGPIVSVFFSSVTCLCTLLLAACYRSGGNRRNYTYMDAVKSHLGATKSIIFQIVVCVYLFGLSIDFIKASSTSMNAICWSLNCPDSTGEINNNLSMFISAIIQICLSQTPDVNQYFLVVIAKIVLSFTYSMIPIGLSIAEVLETGKFSGSLSGISTGTTISATMIWRKFNAIGVIAFAYSFSKGVFEIQDSIKSSPSEASTMKMALQIGIGTSTIFFTLFGCFVYAAFGDLAPENLLTGFGSYEQNNWLINIAHAALFIHLNALYQAYCQPFFLLVEKLVTADRFPNSKFMTCEIKVPIPGLQPNNLNIFRFVWRTTFVLITIVISKFVPFSSEAVGVIRALGFWPLSVYFPIEMYIEVKQIPRWSRKWVFLQILNFSGLVITIATAAGSIAEIVLHLKP